MKKLLRYFVLTAVAAFTLAACSKNEDIETPEENEYVTLKFNVRNSDNGTLTKALLGTDANGKKFLDWENGDKIGTFSVGSFVSGQTTTTTSNNNAGTVEVEGDDFTLNVQVYNQGSITNIYSYYPYSAAAGKNKEAAVITIPSSQFVNTEGFDADAMPMAGSPITVDMENVTANTDTPCGTINFSNLGSIINFKIYSSVATDETLTSVKYIAPGIGGTFTIDLTAVDGTENTLVLTEKDTEDEITTTIRNNNPVIGTGKTNAIDVFMVVAPGSYSETQVVVTTNLRTYTLTASGEKTYTRSHIKPMYVNIQSGTPGDLPSTETWVKVTSAADFTAGTYYILNWDESKYLPNDEAGSAPAAKAFNGVVSNDMRWEATVSEGGLIFKNPTAELYLWGQDGTNNGVRVKKEAPSNASDKVWYFTNDNKFNVIASVGNTRYLATYNNNGTQQDWRNYQYSSLGDGTNTNASNQVTSNVNNFPAVFYKLEDNTPRFTVESPLNVSAEEDTYTINITRKNFTGAITVSVPNDCDWIEADNVAENGTSFDILVLANTGSSRSATLTLSGNNVDSKTLVVIQDAAEAGTETNPYSVSEAIEVAEALGKNEQTTEEVYISGIVSEVVSYNSTYKSITYYISDNGTETNQLQVYGGLNLIGSDFTGVTDLAVGDVVVVKGYLYNFNGNTPEVYQNSHITSITKVTRYAITLGSVSNGTISASGSEAAEGATVLLNATPAQGYALSSWNVINNTTSETVPVNNNSFIMPASSVTVTATFSESSQTTVTFTASDFSGQGTANTGSDVSVTKSGITIFTDKGYGTTQFRVYKGGNLTISSPSGTNIKTIEFTFSGSSYTGGLNTSYTNVGQNSKTFSSLGSQARFMEIKVTYE